MQHLPSENHFMCFWLAPLDSPTGKHERRKTGKVLHIYGKSKALHHCGNYLSGGICPRINNKQIWFLLWIRNVVVNLQQWRIPGKTPGSLFFHLCPTTEKIKY